MIENDRMLMRLYFLELETRIIAGTNITTEKFLNDFLIRAENIFKITPIKDREWVSDRISSILAKFSFKAAEDG